MYIVVGAMMALADIAGLDADQEETVGGRGDPTTTRTGRSRRATASQDGAWARSGHPAETIDCLMQEADVDEDEVASMFEEVTGKPLRPTAAR